MENLYSFPFFTMSKNQRDAKYVINALAKNPIKYGKYRFDSKPFKSVIPRTNEPIETGK